MSVQSKLPRLRVDAHLRGADGERRVIAIGVMTSSSNTFTSNRDEL